MKIQLLRNTVVGGKPCVVGDVLDVDKHAAGYLISIKKARGYEELETATAEPVEKAVKPSPKRRRKAGSKK